MATPMLDLAAIAEAKRRANEKIASDPALQRFIGVEAPVDNSTGMQYLANKYGSGMSSTSMGEIANAYSGTRDKYMDSALNTGGIADAMNAGGNQYNPNDIFEKAQQIGESSDSLFAKAQALQQNMGKGYSPKEFEKRSQMAKDLYAKADIMKKFEQMQSGMDAAENSANDFATREATSYMDKAIQKRIDETPAPQNTFTPNEYLSQRVYQKRLEEAMRRGDVTGAIVAGAGYDNEYIGAPSAKTVSASELLQWKAMQPQATASGGSNESGYFVRTGGDGRRIVTRGVAQDPANASEDDAFATVLQLGAPSEFSGLSRADIFKKIDAMKKNLDPKDVALIAQRGRSILQKSAQSYKSEKEANQHREAWKGGNQGYDIVDDGLGNVKTVPRKSQNEDIEKAASDALYQISGKYKQRFGLTGTTGASDSTIGFIRAAQGGQKQSGESQKTEAEKQVASKVETKTVGGKTYAKRADGNWVEI